MSTQNVSSLNELLPQDVLDSLRKAYADAIGMAERFFDTHSADEDAVTGGLGQELARIGKIEVDAQGTHYEIEFDYQKLRGRGLGAPEKPTGADGIFQISVFSTQGDKLFTKGLPFQSKTEWSGRDDNLVKQAEKMQSIFGGGLVIDYSSNGYKACNTNQVIEADGRKRLAEENRALKTLESALCGDFLDCRIGSRDLYFDPESEQFRIRRYRHSDDFHVLDTTILVDALSPRR